MNTLFLLTFVLLSSCFIRTSGFDPIPFPVEIKMRDGVKLHTEVFIATHPLPWEKRDVVMMRTPYGADHEKATAKIFLEQGYHVLSQDFRGRYGSGGAFSFWRYASRDAVDTMKWVNKQEWSSGVIFATGFSAPGIACYLDAADGEIPGEEGMRAQYVGAGSGNLHKTTYQGGALRESLIVGWLHSIGEGNFSKNIIENEGLNSWWNPLVIDDDYDKITYAAVHYAGWYDIFLQQQLDVFEGYRTESVPQVRDLNYLFVDPFGHCVGGAVPMPKNRTGLPQVMALELFKILSSSKSNKLQQYDPPKAITFYVMGPTNAQIGNYWCTLNEWPKSTEMKFFLTSQRTLSNTAPESGDSLSFISDPYIPIPTLGGNNLLLPLCGPQDQRLLESNTTLANEMVIFSSDVFDNVVAITGRMHVHLTVMSNCTDTDFVVKLTDVYPDGTSMLIQDGIQRMKWRDDPSVPSPIDPSKAYNIVVDVWSTSYIFNPGHRLRLTVQASNFPKFSVNPNNGKLLVEGGPRIIAKNSILIGENSFVSLPQVSVDDLPPYDIPM